jgi:hypothetical protein
VRELPGRWHWFFDPLDVPSELVGLGAPVYS